MISNALPLQTIGDELRRAEWAARAMRARAKLRAAQRRGMPGEVEAREDVANADEVLSSIGAVRALVGIEE